MAKKKKVRPTPLHDDIKKFYADRSNIQRPITASPDEEEINPGLGYYNSPYELQQIKQQIEYGTDDENKERHLGILEGNLSGYQNVSPLHFIDVTAHKIVKQEVENDLSKIGQANDDLQNLQKMQRFFEIQDALNDTKTSEESKKALIKEYKDLYTYFKTDGLKSRKVVETMYDVGNLSEDDLALLTFSEQQNRDRYWKKEWEKVKGPWETIKYVGSNLLEGIGNIFVDLGKGTKLETYGNRRDQLQQLYDFDLDDKSRAKILNKTFVPDTYGFNNAKHKAKIQEELKSYNDDIEEYRQDLQNDLKQLRTGKFNLYINNPILGNRGNLFDEGIKVYSPEDINWNVANQYEKEWDDASIFNPLTWHKFLNPNIVMPEVASSIGMFKHQAQVMVADRGLNYVINYALRRLPTEIAGGWAGKGLKAIGIGSSVGLGMYGAIQSRKEETGLEKIGALKSKVLKDFADNNVDLNEIYRQYRQFAKDELLLDPSMMSEEDLLSLGLSFDVPVKGVKNYDKIIKNAQKGLMKLVNANNALAIHDYLEMLPFMTSGGKILDRIGKTAFGAAKHVTPNFIKNTARAALDSKIVKGIDSYTRKLTETFIRNALKSGNSKHIFSGLAAKDFADFAKNKLKLAGYEAFMEGGEEGAQELLQQRYLRGEFEDYTKPYQMFDASEMLGTNGLYSQAFFDFFGIDPNDPDNASVNIRKAMTIGAVSSAWFSGALSSLSNVRNNSEDQNIRQLIHRLRADHTVGRLISNYGSRAQDASTVATYFNKLRQNKGQMTHIINALQNAKSALDETVTNVNKTDLDADMNLAVTTGLVYNSSNTEEILKALDIKEGSDRHKQFVIDAVTAIQDNNNLSELLKSQNDKLNAHYNNVKQLTEQFIQAKNTNSEEALQQFKQQNPVLSVILENLYESNSIVYEKRKKDAKILLDDKKEKLEEIKNRKNKDESLTDEQIYYLERYNLTEKYSKADEKERKKILKKAEERFNSFANISDDFIKIRISNAINIANSYFNMISVENALQAANDQLERLKFTREQMGVDIDTAPMQNMVNALQEMLDKGVKVREQLQESFPFIKNDENFYKELFNYYYGITNAPVNLSTDGIYDNNQSILDLMKAMAFNLAMKKSIEKRASIYVDAIGAYDEQGKMMDPKTVLSEVKKSLDKAEKRLYIARRMREDELGLPEGSLSDENLRRTEQENTQEQQNQDEQANQQEQQQEIIPVNSPSEDLQRAEETIEGRALPTEEENRRRGKELREKAEKNAENVQQSENNNDNNQDEPQDDSQSQEQEPQQDQLPEQISVSEEPETDDQQDDQQGDQTGDDTQNDTYEPTDDYQNQGTFDDEDEHDNISENPQQNDQPTEKEQLIEDKSNQEEPIIPTISDELPSDQDPIIEDSNYDNENVEAQLAEIELENEQSVQSAENEQDEKIKYVEDKIDAVWNDVDRVIIKDIDKLSYNSEYGLWEYDGKLLSEEQSESIWLDTMMNQAADSDLQLSQESLPEGNQKPDDEKRMEEATNDTVGDLVSCTFFYRPDAETPIFLGRDEKPVVFEGKTIRSGAELSKKLMEKKNGVNWLSTTKKFYIVTNPSKTDNLLPEQDIRDVLTVALCIEDGNDIYVVTLRSLGVTTSKITDEYKASVENNEYLRSWCELIGTKTIINDGQENVTGWLETRNIDWDKVLEFLRENDKEGNYGIDDNTSYITKLRILRHAVTIRAQQRARKVYEGTVSSGVNGKQYTFEYWWKQQMEVKGIMMDGVAKQEYFIHAARQDFAKSGRKVLSRAAITRQIMKLRQFRNQIIDAYLGAPREENGQLVYDFPETPRTDVTPLEVKQSNGKFDATDTFRSIVPEEQEIDAVTQRLLDGDLILGYGTGPFGNTPYAINNVFGNTEQQVLYNGRGLAGKIYLLVQSFINPKSRVPMMLSEEKFNYQIDEKGRMVYNNNITLSMDPNTGQRSDNSNRQPSAAEIILYMLCGKLYEFNGMTAKEQESVTEFFVHSGQKTLISNQKQFAYNPIKQFLGKQLYSDRKNEILYISVPTSKSVPATDFELKMYTYSELFADTQQGAENRLEVVHAIANQMHWNTDLEHMKSTLNLTTETSPITKFLRNLFIEEFNKTGTEENLTVNIGGCEQLQFKYSDFFDSLESEPKKVNVTAWMLKNMKLKTNISEQIFRDPFVFANGVKSDGKAVQKRTLEEKTNTQTPVAQSKSVEELTKEHEEKVSKLLEQNNLTSRYVVGESKVGTRRFIYNPKDINKEDGSEVNPGDVIDLIVSNIMDIFTNVYKETPERLSQIKENLTRVLENEMATIEDSYANKKSLQIDVKDNNSASIKLINDKKIPAKPTIISGMFSTKKSDQPFDEQSIRNWLYDKLGLDGASVVVVDAIGSTLENEEIFGLTNVAIDEMFGYIQLSRRGGTGVGYHEAWHFINLLVHDKRTRESVYKSALKKNKNLFNENTTLDDIEEWLAEEFRKYVELKESKSWTSKIKRLFKNISDFMYGTASKYAYYSVFKSIQRGMYVSKGKVKINQQSALEFARSHNTGIFSLGYTFSGGPKVDLESLNTYHDWIEAVHSVSNAVLLSMNISTPEEVSKITNNDSTFDEIVVGKLTSIKEELEEYEDEYEKEISILNDLLQNKALLKKLFKQQMESIGLKAKVKKVKDIDKANNNKIDNVDAEDLDGKLQDPDNEELKHKDPDITQDRVQLTVNKKDNAGMRAKMFFKTLPVYASTYTENGLTFYIDTDRYGVEKLYDDNEAWFTILNSLYACSSFADTDEKGDYKSTSIMGVVTKLKNMSGFWRSVYDKLEELQQSNSKSSIALKSQIFSALCGAKNQISFVQLENKKSYGSQATNVNDMLADQDDTLGLDDDISSKEYVTDEAILDRTRTWSLIGDDALIVTRQVPRRWSTFLYECGYVTFDYEKKQSVVNKLFVDALNQNLKNVQKVLKHSQDYGVCRQAVMDLLNFIGIPADENTIDSFIHLAISKSSTESSRYAIHEGQYSITDRISFLKRVFGISEGKNKPAINGAGSLYDVIQSIIKSVDKDKIIVSKKERGLDEVFNNYQQNSHIAYLAIAYNTHHPNLQDQTVKGPNGDRYYPVNQANYFASMIRKLNDPYETKQGKSIHNMRKSPYCKHSLILQATDNVQQDDPSSKFKLCTCVGMKDANRQKGADYFDISDRDDFLYKMFLTENDYLINPTMADKKTYYGLHVPNLQLVHDVIVQRQAPYSLLRKTAKEYIKQNNIDLEKKSISSWLRDKRDAYMKKLELEEELADVSEEILEKASIYEEIEHQTQLKYEDTIHNDNGGSISVNIGRFSSRTLNIFAGYFIDELNTVKQYYSKDNIAYLVSHPDQLIENFHGNVKNGKLDFSGNGGKFRYFYDIPFDYMNGNKQRINLNQTLEVLYKLEQKILSGELKEIKGLDIPGDGVNKKIKKADLGKNPDGFELIRQYLNNLQKRYVKGLLGGAATNELLDNINSILMARTEESMQFVTEDGSSFQLGELNKDGKYMPLSIPSQFAKKYIQDANVMAAFGYEDVYDFYSDELPDELRQDIFRSIMANYVANTAISVIETEKVFSGDPAFYKMKANKNDKTTTVDFNCTVDFGSGAEHNDINIGFTCEVENLYDTYSDKIKRLGGLLSPGAQLRLDFSKAELEKYPEFTSKRYTILDVEDIITTSEFIEPIENTFRKQLLVDHLRCNNTDWFIEKFVNKLGDYTDKKNLRKEKYAFEDAIDLIYNDEEFYKKVFDNLSESTKNDIKALLKAQTSPYRKINVADAQVFIRPAAYRKIKVGLGEWSFEERDGYSDEIAYNIIENGIYIGSNKKLRDKYKNRKMSDTEWMSDPELSKIVAKFQTNVLKMSYFNNMSEKVGTIDTNRPVYNKMAMFPLFKFHRASATGKALYDRMNNESLGTIDKIAFKSAIKVGAVKNAPNLIEQNDERKSKNVYSLSDILNSKSSVTLDYTTDKVEETTPENGESLLQIRVQNFEELRLQLNTHAHDSVDRSIGTQMFKIAFSNIIDDALYGPEGNKRLGSAIKKDIMRQINALTNLGIEEVKARFYTVQLDEEGKPKIDKNGNVLYKIDSDEVRKYAQAIITTNGLGVIAEDLITQGYPIACLTSREIFENAISTLLNSEIVDITTNGGTAIQQSIFGFAATGYGNTEVVTQEENSFMTYNEGKELNWNKENGTMEVILSMNFFKSVVPKEFQTDYITMRQWLIDHDVIKGTKSDGTKSNPKPFGIGYRIPTQGMSSMFGFIVADVLPMQAGDTIIVPREFTAQTGSDFDVDKLYIATFSYKDGVRESMYQQSEDGKISKIDSADITKGMRANALLNDYLSIITDKRNYSNARSSIDTITDIIHDELLDKYLRDPVKGYIPSFFQLTPQFQALRKREFGVGKSGIGPFALNITNMALTQAVHVSIDFGDNEYELNPLDRIEGKDELRIADWLSAMVNAHVDVAKDAYVFDLNVNSVTYNMCNLLLRCGYGKKTFLFLAQDCLKKYSNAIMNAGGMYGAYDTSNKGQQSLYYKKKQVMNTLVKKLVDELKRLQRDKSVNWTEDQLDLLKNVISAYDTENKKKNGGKQKETRKEAKIAIFDDKTKSVFGVTNRAANAIITSRKIKKGEETTAQQRADCFIIQLYALEAFNDLQTYAEEMSELVKASQIDTKKFGNNLVSKYNFLNSVNYFRNKDDQRWISTDEELNKKYMQEYLDSHPIDPTLPAAKQKKEEHKRQLKAKTYASKKVLNDYFMNTYLDLKLRAAVNYQRKLLLGQSFKSSPVFNDIFHTICMELFGKWTSEGFNVDGSYGKIYQGYSKQYNEDILKVIGSFIDDMFRFSSLVAKGKNITGGKMAIDLAKQGDLDQIKQTTFDLIYGEYYENDNGEIVKRKDSIFDRTSQLISEIKSNPSEYKGLVDEKGNLLNDLLLYLNPLGPTKQYPIGRMWLNTPRHLTKSESKSTLQAAFAELLTYKKGNMENAARVRELAQDLVQYAYYSSYDQATRNSFFELVPLPYRKQYDESLKKSLTTLRGTSQDVKKQLIEQICQISPYYVENQEQLSYDQLLSMASNVILDIMSRNFWYDNSYVKVIKLPRKTSNIDVRKKNGQFTVYGKIKRSKNKGQQFPTFIMTSREDARYVKVVKGGEVMLYRKSGGVMKETKNGLTQIGNVYIPVTKAGMHSGTNSQFELYCADGVSSIFESNKLKKAFAEDNVRKEIEEFITRANERPINDNKKHVYSEEPVSIQYEIDDILPANMSSNEESYQDTIETAESFTGDYGAGRVIVVEGANRYVANKSDVIININNELVDISSEEYKESKYRNIQDEDEQKTVSIGLTISDEQIDQIVKKIKEAYKIIGEEINIGFTTNTFDNQWMIDDNLRKQFIDREVEQFEQSLTDRKYKNKSAEELQKLVDHYRSLLESTSVEDINNKKDKSTYFDSLRDIRAEQVASTIQKIMQKLLNEGVINKIYAPVSNGKLTLARAVTNVQKEYVNKISGANEKTVIVFNDGTGENSVAFLNGPGKYEIKHHISTFTEMREAIAKKAIQEQSKKEAIKEDTRVQEQKVEENISEQYDKPAKTQETSTEQKSSKKSGFDKFKNAIRYEEDDLAIKKPEGLNILNEDEQKEGEQNKKNCKNE